MRLWLIIKRGNSEADPTNKDRYTYEQRVNSEEMHSSFDNAMSLGISAHQET